MARGFRMGAAGNSGGVLTPDNKFLDSASNGSGHGSASTSKSFTITEDGFYCISFSASQANLNNYYWNTVTNLTVNGVAVGNVKTVNVMGTASYYDPTLTINHLRTYCGYLHAGDVVVGTISGTTYNTGTTYYGCPVTAILCVTKIDS